VNVHAHSFGWELLDNIAVAVDRVTGGPIMKLRWLKRRKSSLIVCARFWMPWSTRLRACSARLPHRFLCASGSPVIQCGAAA